MVTEAERLSQMLWDAREIISMFNTLIEHQVKKPDDHTRRVLNEIDEYRAERGWSPHGFGGETDEH